MARIKRGILNGFNGKLANINGYSNYGKSAIRTIPTQRIDNNSPLQSTNRAIFKKVSEFQNQIYKDYLDLLFKLSYGNATPYFKFNKYNQRLFDINGLDNYMELVQSNGSLLGVSDFRITAFASNSYIRIEWLSNANDYNGFDNDILYCFAYNIDDRLIQLPSVFPVRSDSTFELPVTTGWSSRDTVIIYGSFVKYNLLSVSKTSFAFRP